MSKKRPKLSFNPQEPKIHPQQQDDQQLIPGLPDHVAQLCLSKIHPTLLYSVCPLWRNFIYSPLFPPFLSLYTICTPTSSPTPTSQLVTPIHFSSFDPISGRWRGLPHPPHPPLKLLLHHPSFISRNLPIQSLTASDTLAMVAATTQHLLPALTRPIFFNPVSRKWGYGPEIRVPRRWCAAGALGSCVYLASGVGSHFSTDTARSVEKWDLVSEGCRWGKSRPLWDGRFSREAAEAIGWKGKLCMVNVKGNAAKQGAVYDSKRDTWEEMSDGMVGGWRGPAASMDEEVIYVVDELKGLLRKYDEKGDTWVDVLESERLRGAQQMTARGGRVCVVCYGGSQIVVVDVVAAPARMWVVEPPPGYNAVAVHVLPRMSHVDLEECQL